jgi:hypothetical protein
MYYFSIIFVILNANALILRCIAVYRDGTGKNLTAYQLSPVMGEQKTPAWKAFS